MNLHAAGPHWISFGILDSGGGSLRWWRDQFIADKDNDGDVVYERMMADAAGVPVGSEGLLFLHISSVSAPLAALTRAGFFLDFIPGTAALMPRGLSSRASASTYGKAWRSRGRQDSTITEMRTGGGERALGALVAMKADVYGIPVSTLGHEEAGILGAAMLAGVGIGAYACEADAANRLAQTREQFIPDQHTSARYDKQYAVFQDLHNRLEPSFQRAADLASS